MSKYDEISAELLKRDLYVDNVICTFPNETLLAEFYRRSKIIMYEGGFNLREWSSNHENFIQSISESDRCVKTEVKVLGTTWDTVLDKQIVSPYVPPVTDSITKRQMVSYFSKTFDPYGYLLPVTVSGKLLLQEVWKTELGWDEILPNHIHEKWLEHIKNLTNISLSLDRKFSDLKNPTLHVFGDASKKGFGAVAYLVENGFSNFVIAKSRIVPIKAPTLPQLELTAANLAARLARFVMKTFEKSFQIADVFIWSDSEITLHWLSSKTMHKKPYVRQRIQNIRELVPEAKFRYVKSSENSSDLMTRGINSKEFISSNL